MADEPTAEAIRWLHPATGPVPMRFQGPDGSEWTITVHWADVGGKAMPVGMDLRSFVRRHDCDVGLPGGPRPVTTDLLRRLGLANLIDASRRWNNLGNRRDAWRLAKQTAKARGDAARRAAALAEKPTKAGRRPDHGRGDDFIAELAALYLQARRQGGTQARQPWRYVAEQLTARGVRGAGPNGEITNGQLKNWRRRAKPLIEEEGNDST